jgi:hypothetical protein
MDRITREVVDAMLDERDSYEAFCVLSEWIRPRHEDEPELGLSRPEMNFYLFSTYDAEVCRNGHLWFFLNPYGDHALRTVIALEELRVDVPRSILSEACLAFPGSRVPTSQDERKKLIWTLPYEETMALWNRLDRAYFGDSDRQRADLEQVMAYMRKHRDEIAAREIGVRHWDRPNTAGPLSMQNRQDAIAWLTARGNYAFEWDTYAPGAFGVATAADEDDRIRGWLLVICPVGENWEVRSVLDVPPAPSFETLVFDTLEQAVRSAADHITGRQ